MPSNEAYPARNPEVLSAPVDDAALDGRLDHVRASVIDQLTALLAEDETPTQAPASKASPLERLPESDEVVQGTNTAEAGALDPAGPQQRRRLGGLGRKLLAVGQPAARAASELAAGVMETAGKALDEMERQEEKRRTAAYSEKADIELQRANGARDFGQSDLKYERRNGRPSPRRVLPPPGSDDE